MPTYDKSAFEGLGDRVPQERWVTVNQESPSTVQIFILEGWCVGFRALPDEQLMSKWQDAVKRSQNPNYQGRLGRISLNAVSFINEALRDYDALTNQLDALIHLDAEETNNVYEWRRESEARLRRLKGSGMTDAQVRKFVDGYYPAYELFIEGLRVGTFDGEKGRQLRIVIGNDRKARQAIQI